MWSRLHVQRSGSGEPIIVLLHGGGDGAFVWDSLASTLASRFTIVAPDFRGHGESAWDPSGDYSIDAFVEDAASVIEQSGEQDFILIGHSMGAHVALRLGARYRARILAMVLVDFSAEINPEGAREASSLIGQGAHTYPSVESYVKWLRETRPLARADLLTSLARRALRAERGEFRPKLDPRVGHFLGGIRANEARLLWQLIQHQTCPTLLIRGDASAVVSRASAEKMVSALPNGEIATIRCAGHAVMMDNPAEFESVVMAFLGRLSHEAAPRR